MYLEVPTGQWTQESVTYHNITVKITLENLRDQKHTVNQLLHVPSYFEPPRV